MNHPDSLISACVSCLGEIDASMIGSSNETCITQWEQYARVTPSWLVATTCTPFIICPRQRFRSRSMKRPYRESDRSDSTADVARSDQLRRAQSPSITGSVGSTSVRRRAARSNRPRDSASPISSCRSLGVAGNAVRTSRSLSSAVRSRSSQDRVKLLQTRLITAIVSIGRRALGAREVSAPKIDSNRLLTPTSSSSVPPNASTYRLGSSSRPTST